MALQDQETSKSVAWVFTVNNPGEWTIPHHEDIAYICGQRERAPTTGTIHFQGYVRFKNRKSMRTVKGILGRADAHLEKARGTEAQCRDYCSKEETRDGEFTFWGVYDPDFGQRQGKRTDLVRVAQTIRAGKTMAEIFEAHPEEFIKYHGGIDKAISELAKRAIQPVREIHITVLWGETGTGKSHRVRTAFPNAYIVSAGPHPWDMYNGEDTIVFEEFTDSNWKITDMLKYCDKWKIPLACRYNNKYANWTRIYILSNNDPATYWSIADQAGQNQRPAWLRRISDPMGRVFQVANREQEIPLEWWLAPSAPAAPAARAATPVLQDDGDTDGGHLVRNNAAVFLDVTDD